MKTNEEKCCGTCEYWDSTFYDPEDMHSRTGECSRFPPIPIYIPAANDYMPEEYSPWTGVMYCCGEWLQNTEGRTKENRYGYDLYDEEDDAVEESVVTDFERDYLETKDDTSVCLMSYDNDYFNTRHDRYWCQHCNNHNDVDKGEQPKFCVHCGRKVFACYCKECRM